MFASSEFLWRRSIAAGVFPGVGDGETNAVVLLAFRARGYTIVCSRWFPGGCYTTRTPRCSGQAQQASLIFCAGCSLFLLTNSSATACELRVISAAYCVGRARTGLSTPCTHGGPSIMVKHVAEFARRVFGAFVSAHFSGGTVPGFRR